MRRKRKGEELFVGSEKEEKTTREGTFSNEGYKSEYKNSNRINIDMCCNKKQCKQCQVKVQRYLKKQLEANELLVNSRQQLRRPIMRTTTTTTTTMGKPRTPVKTSTLLLLLVSSSLVYLYCEATLGSGRDSAIKFNLDTNSYSGLTFTFDPRLDKRVEWLHFEHWLSIMQHSSSLLYDALNGRAHLAEIRVLIPYKWRQVSWPVLHKPGVPIMTNRRLRFSDSDVIVGFEGKFDK